MSQLFLIFLALGQLDLLLARLFSDLAANFVTTALYLENKSYDPRADEENDAIHMVMLNGDDSRSPRRAP